MVNMREVVNDVRSMLIVGCQQRHIPGDLPPRNTIDGYFCLWVGKEVRRRSFMLSTYHPMSELRAGQVRPPASSATRVCRARTVEGDRRAAE
jgi:hypothetical protein